MLISQTCIGFSNRFILCMLGKAQDQSPQGVIVLLRSIADRDFSLTQSPWENVARSLTRTAHQTMEESADLIRTVMEMQR